MSIIASTVMLDHADILCASFSTRNGCQSRDIADRRLNWSCIQSRIRCPPSNGIKGMRLNAPRMMFHQMNQNNRCTRISIPAIPSMPANPSSATASISISCTCITSPEV